MTDVGLFDQDQPYPIPVTPELADSSMPEVATQPATTEQVRSLGKTAIALTLAGVVGLGVGTLGTHTSEGFEYFTLGLVAFIGGVSKIGANMSRAVYRRHDQNREPSILLASLSK